MLIHPKRSMPLTWVLMIKLMKQKLLEKWKTFLKSNHKKLLTLLMLFLKKTKVVSEKTPTLMTLMILILLAQVLPL